MLGSRSSSRSIGTAAGTCSTSCPSVTPHVLAGEARSATIARVASIRPRYNMSSRPSNSGAPPQTAPSLASVEDYRITTNVEVSQIPQALRKNCVLFYTNDMEDLAKRVADQAGGNIELGRIRWRCALVELGARAAGRRHRSGRHQPGRPLEQFERRKFADGFPDLFVEDALRIRNQHVAFLASFHNPSVIFEQISVIYALPRLFVGSFTLVLPFFPTGTLERVSPRPGGGAASSPGHCWRHALCGTMGGAVGTLGTRCCCCAPVHTAQVETEGDVATAFTLARILSNVPPSRGGPTSLVIFDIHALQERFYFGDAVLPLFESGVPLLLERLAKLPDRENVRPGGAGASRPTGQQRQQHQQQQQGAPQPCTSGSTTRRLCVARSRSHTRPADHHCVPRRGRLEALPLPVQEGGLPRGEASELRTAQHQQLLSRWGRATRDRHDRA